MQNIKITRKIPKKTQVKSSRYVIDITRTSFIIRVTYRRCHEKIYVSNYAFITLLYEFVDRGQMH